MVYSSRLLAVAIIILFFTCLSVSAADYSQNLQPILLGQSSALTGPAKDLGLELRGGLRAALAKLNDEGGVGGREVELLSVDDGYEPDKAIHNTLQLINDKKVFMLVGEVGTPTSKAVVPIAEKNKVPFFAPFTGAEFLRKPFSRYVINIRPSYFQEMERLADFLIKQRKIRRIACFYQNDSYGFAGLRGIQHALARRDMQLVSTGSYERNTVAVMGALQEIYQAEPEAVILVGAYSACAEFIKLSKTKIRDDILFCNISFVGTKSLKETLGGYGYNVIVSQVVPLPTDHSIPLIREYFQAMLKYQHDVPVGFTSLEGYIAGKFFGEVARKVPGVLTRETFIDTMQQVGRFDLGGVVLEFGPNDHQGLDTIYLTRIFPEVEEIEISE